MLSVRIATAAIALPCVFFLTVYAPVSLFSAGIFLMTTGGLYEYFRLIDSECSLSWRVGFFWGVVVALVVVTSNDHLVLPVFVAGFVIIFISTLQDPIPHRSIRTISLFCLGVVYLGMLLPFLVLIRQGEDGPSWVLFVLLIAMLGDTGGYIVGRSIGKRKLLPSVSPGKTVEGAVGSLFGSLGAWWIAGHWLLPAHTGPELLVLAMVGGMLAQLGDLCESALKRACGVKDSGRLFPGHGGVLDRIDSLLFLAPFIYYGSRFVR